MNKCFLIGNLTRDPELRTTGTGTSVCSFTLAVSRRFPNQNGERETDFINIVSWKALADNCAKFLKKGSQAAVTGSIQIRNYEDKNGQRRSSIEIMADEVQFISRATDTARSSVPSPAPSLTSGATEIDEDLPF